MRSWRFKYRRHHEIENAIRPESYREDVCQGAIGWWCIKEIHLSCSSRRARATHARLSRRAVSETEGREVLWLTYTQLSDLDPCDTEPPAFSASIRMRRGIQRQTCHCLPDTSLTRRFGVLRGVHGLHAGLCTRTANRKLPSRSLVRWRWLALLPRPRDARQSSGTGHDSPAGPAIGHHRAVHREGPMRW